MSNRRSFLQRALGLGAGLVTAPRLFADEATHRGPDSGSARPILDAARAGTGAARNIAVTTPDVADLPFTMENGTKVFRLIAEPVKQAILPNRTLDLWGFNGSAPGPTIQVNQGDHVRVLFENHLPEPTSVHWHGFEDQNRYDGQPGISQQPVRPGGRFVYEFDIHQSGTYFYHSHMSMQQMIGMLGGFIMHPAAPYQPSVDHDFLIHLQEYAVLPSSTIPNSMSMEYNWLVLNGKAGPAITPMIVPLGSRVRIRFVNLGMDHHPMHLHGHTFYITGTEGGRIPETAWWPGNTVLVGVAQARDIEFVANNPGDWMVHCHLPHHNMNRMSSTVGRMTRMAPTRSMPTGDRHANQHGHAGGHAACSDGRGLWAVAWPRYGRCVRERYGYDQRRALRRCHACGHAETNGAADATRRDRAERQQRAELPAGRLYGKQHDEHGYDGGHAGKRGPAARMERADAGHDDAHPRAASAGLRAHDGIHS